MNLTTINNYLLYIPTLVIVLVLGFVYLKHRKQTLEPKLLKKIVWSLGIFLALMVGLKISLQYAVYQNDPFTKLFLPPYQTIDWFAFSMWSRHAAPFLFALASGFIMYLAALYANRFSQREFFMENDKYILLLAALMVGWPNYILFLLALIVLAVLQSIIITVKRKGEENRIMITNAMIASVLLIILFGNAVGPYINISLLTI